MMSDLPDAKLPDGVLPNGRRPWPRGAARRAGIVTDSTIAYLRDLDDRIEQHGTDGILFAAALDPDERDPLHWLRYVGWVSHDRDGNGHVIGITPAGDRVLRLGG